MRDTGAYGQTELAFVPLSRSSLRAAEQAEETGAHWTGQARLLAAYEAAGDYGLTDDEALAASGLHPNALRPRRRELMRQHAVELRRGPDGEPVERLSRARRLACVYRRSPGR